MAPRTQLAIWIFFALATGFFLWSLRAILPPFLAGAAIAYLVDPAVDRFEAKGLSRALGTVLVCLLLLGVVIILALVFAPLVYEQLVRLAQNAPAYLEALSRILEKIEMSDRMDVHFGQIVTFARAYFTTHSGELLEGVWSGGTALIDVLGLMLVTPVVAFYLLLDWDRMIGAIDAKLPRDHAPVIRAIAADIDRTLAAFVRGQLSICLILGLFYAIALTIMGLEFGVVIGMLAGLLSFIPYVGALLGGLLSAAVAAFQFWPEWSALAGVLAIFAGGQVLDGNLLSPRLVGRGVGLHPVWLIFALSASGALLGFAGLLIGVPLAAAIGVLVRRALGRYTSGALFLGAQSATTKEEQDRD